MKRLLTFFFVLIFTSILMQGCGGGGGGDGDGERALGLVFLKLALVFADLALDLRSHHIDGRVHVLRRLMAGDLEAVV